MEIRGEIPMPTSDHGWTQDMTDIIHRFRRHRLLLEVYFKLGVIPADWVRILGADFQQATFEKLRDTAPND